MDEGSGLLDFHIEVLDNSSRYNLGGNFQNTKRVCIGDSLGGGYHVVVPIFRAGRTGLSRGEVVAVEVDQEWC